MTERYVLIPFAGYVSVAIESDSKNEEDLIEQAMRKVDMEIVSKGDTEVVEWDIYKQIVKDNVLYVYQNKAEVVE